MERLRNSHPQLQSISEAVSSGRLRKSPRNGNPRAMTAFASQGRARSSLRAVRVAFQVATQALPDYSSKFSKQAFTQPQLLTLLLLKQFFQTNYRSMVQYLHDRPDVRRFLKLQSVPHYSTLAHAAKRLQQQRLLFPAWQRFRRAYASTRRGHSHLHCPPCTIVPDPRHRDRISGLL